jgi:hypothetical protein
MQRLLPCIVAFATIAVAATQALAGPYLQEHLPGFMPAQQAPVAMNMPDGQHVMPGSAMPMGPTSANTAAKAPTSGSAPAMPGTMPQGPAAVQAPAMPMPSAAPQPAAAPAPMPGETGPQAAPPPAATPMPMPAATPAPTMAPMPMPTATSPRATPMPMPTATPAPAPTGAAAGASCTVVPIGQANPSTEPEPMGPIWCFPLSPSPTTRTIDAGGGWVDTFATNVQMGSLNDREMDYRVFNAFGSSIRGGTFLNNNHWMIDLVDTSAFRLSGGVMLSPNKAFTFENGKLVVEVDAAAGQDGAGGADVFYEVDVSPAAAPTGVNVDTLYGYGQFGNVGAIGCRLERAPEYGGHPICSMYDNTSHNAGQGGRVWETQGVGTARTAPTVEGGYSGYAIPGTSLHGSDVFRLCNTNQMDMFCRDRFRFEFTKTSLTIFVNGYQWYKIDGLYASNPATGADNRLPDSWFGPAGVHVYFTSWINSGQHTPHRWHWGRVAVNPHSGSGFTAPSAAPTFCLGQPQNTCAMH